MKGDEPCNGRMVWCRHTFEKVHEVDVPPAGSFNISARIEAVHRGVDHDLEHLTRCRLVFPDSVVSIVQIRKIHSLHERTQKADRVISGDHVFHFQCLHIVDKQP